MGLGIMMVIMFIFGCVACLVAYNPDKKSKSALKTTAVMCALIFVAVSARSYFTTYSNDHTVTCYVNSKDRGADNGSYRVYTKNCGVLANEDSKLRWKFNSADVWGQIPETGNVTLHIVGVRIPLLSQFPNILAVVSPAK